MSLFTSNSPQQTTQIAENLAKKLIGNEIILLSGNLGVGKTIFAKGIADVLRVKEPITSPSFSIMNQYRGIFKLYHIDCYRLESMDDALVAGLDEALQGNGICIVEWPEKVPELFSDLASIHINIQVQEGKRKIEIKEIREFL